MNQEQKLVEILAIVSSMKADIVMKRILNDRCSQQVRTTTARLDLFDGFRNKLGLEMASLHIKHDRLESQIQQLAKHAHVNLD